jgi:uncharacterized membrane protein (DUF485 family)
MLHEPAAQSGKDPAASYKMQLGIWMFLAYAIVYAIFVGINLYDPLLMEADIALGLNLATVYGFGLIIAALLQALVYNTMCTRREHALRDVIEGEGK